MKNRDKNVNDNLEVVPIPRFQDCHDSAHQSAHDKADPKDVDDDRIFNKLSSSDLE
jgi:hypothetical protein